MYYVNKSKVYPVTVSTDKIIVVYNFPCYKKGLYEIYCTGPFAKLQRRWFKTAPKPGDELTLYVANDTVVGVDLNGRRQWRKRGFHKGNPPKRTK